jgi:Fic family protein
MLKGVQETARWTTAKIDAIRELMAHTADYLRARAPKIYTREPVELIFEQPYCRIQNIVAAELGNRQTASVHLKMLVDIGVLKEVKVGREKLFIHPKFVELLLHEKQDFTDYDARRKKSPLRDAPGVLPKKGRR